jgi:hypothetical protein
VRAPNIFQIELIRWHLRHEPFIELALEDEFQVGVDLALGWKIPNGCSCDLVSSSSGSELLGTNVFWDSFIKYGYPGTVGH